MNKVAIDIAQLKSHELAQAIHQGDISALEATEASIARIELTDGAVNAFTGKSYRRALREAAAVVAGVAT